MIDGDTHQTQESAAPENDVADLADLQACWARVWASQKDQVSKAKSLAAQEFKLSIKAFLLSMVCILLLVGVSLIIWVALLLTVGYAAFNYGIHWLLIATFFISLNLLMFWLIHRVFKNAARSMGFSTTINAVFGKSNKNAPDTAK
ncbi:hypothetical protein AB6T38_13335 [Aliiglaciecola sp. SL4]|uniref:hypothetical protein n=1 Tax=Aliiglaciecola sp. SL4 TaxID=3239806 RepID=UPI00355BEF5B